MINLPLKFHRGEVMDIELKVLADEREVHSITAF